MPNPEQFRALDFHEADPDEDRSEDALINRLRDEESGSSEGSTGNKTIERSKEPAPVSELEKPDWWKSISPGDIKQGERGDCAFLSTLASMANSDKGREDIGKMFAAKEGGTFEVKFPGADKPIQVTDEEQRSESNCQKQWARVLETAYLKYNHASSSPIEGDGLKWARNATSTRGVAELLTGDGNVSSDQFSLTGVANQRLAFGSTSKENVERDLKKSLEEQRTIVAYTESNVTGNDSKPVMPWHVYSIQDYDADKKTVTLFEPNQHNRNIGKQPGDTVDGVTRGNDGTITMSLDTFYDKFAGMTMSNSNERGQALHHSVDTIKDGTSNYRDAFGSLLKGDFKGAWNNNVKALGQGRNLLEQGMYAGQSAIYDAIDATADRLDFTGD